MGGDFLKQLRIAWIGYILISITFYIGGILCIVFPQFHPTNEAVICGTILILYGIIKIIGYLSKDLYCLAFQYDFACGLLLIVLGIILLFADNKYNQYLLSCLGILILLDSLLGIQTSIDAKRFGLHTWSVILTASIISGILSVLLLIMNTKLFAGLALLSEGFMRQYIVQCTVRLQRPHSSDNEMYQ